MNSRTHPGSFEYSRCCLICSSGTSEAKFAGTANIVAAWKVIVSPCGSCGYSFSSSSNCRVPNRWGARNLPQPKQFIASRISPFRQLHAEEPKLRPFIPYRNRRRRVRARITPVRQRHRARSVSQWRKSRVHGSSTGRSRSRGSGRSDRKDVRQHVCVDRNAEDSCPAFGYMESRSIKGSCGVRVNGFAP